MTHIFAEEYAKMSDHEFAYELGYDSGFHHGCMTALLEGW